MKFQFPKKNLSSKLRKALVPEKEFVERTKGIFLDRYDARYGSEAYIPRFSRTWSLVGTFILIIIATTFGTSVYADTKNVPADSILYPFKRLNESVVLGFASSDKKLQLEATFASRRADEITDLEERAPSSTILTELSSDLDNNITASAVAVEVEDNGQAKAHLEGNQLSDFCLGINGALSASSSIVQTALSGRADLVQRFKTACAAQSIAGTDGASSKDGKDDNNNGTSGDKHGGSQGKGSDGGKSNGGAGSSDNSNSNKDNHEGELVNVVTTSTVKLETGGGEDNKGDHESIGVPSVQVPLLSNPSSTLGVSTTVVVGVATGTIPTTTTIISSGSGSGKTDGGGGSSGSTSTSGSNGSGDGGEGHDGGSGSSTSGGNSSSTSSTTIFIHL